MKFLFFVLLAGRILGGLENTTGWRNSMHIWSTLLNCYYGLLHISLNHFFQEYVYMYLFLFGLVPLAGRILGGL